MSRNKRKLSGAASGLLKRIKAKPGMTDEQSLLSALEDFAGPESERESISWPQGATVSPDEVMDAVARDRESGALAEFLARGRVYYEANHANPQLIDRVDLDGSRETGNFRDGKFIPLKK